MSCSRNVDLKDREIASKGKEGEASGTNTSSLRDDRIIARGKSSDRPVNIGYLIGSAWNWWSLRAIRDYSITRHYYCDKRLGIGFVRNRARELLSARTAALPFRIAYVATPPPSSSSSSCRCVGVTCFPALKNLSLFCAPTYVRTT